MLDKKVFFFVAFWQSRCNYSHPVINISRKEAFIIPKVPNAVKKEKEKEKDLSSLQRTLSGSSDGGCEFPAGKIHSGRRGKEKNTSQRPAVQLETKCSGGKTFSPRPRYCFYFSPFCNLHFVSPINKFELFFVISKHRRGWNI